MQQRKKSKKKRNNRKTSKISFSSRFVFHFLLSFRKDKSFFFKPQLFRRKTQDAKTQSFRKVFLLLSKNANTLFWRSKIVFFKHFILFPFFLLIWNFFYSLGKNQQIYFIYYFRLTYPAIFPETNPRKSWTFLKCYFSYEIYILFTKGDKRTLFPENRQVFPSC